MPKLLLCLLGVFILAACGPGEPDIAYDDLPPGNPVRGVALYDQTWGDLPSCASCHTTTRESGTGPGLGNIADIAADRTDEYSPGEYIYLSIVRPGRDLVGGYSNSMPSDYDEQLSAQDLADLVAYLLEL